MAYSTGSAADLTALLDAVRAFAVAQGWTVDKWVSGSRLLFLRRGITFVTMEGASRTFNSWETGSSVSTTEQVLRMAIGTGITTSLNTYFGHPGSLVTTATDTDRIEINDLTGSFPSYHLFADNALSGHIHVVVQCSTDRWQHFSFGEVDKGGFTHAGVAYAVGTNRYYVRENSQTDPTNPNVYHNDIGRCQYPFVGNDGTNNWPVNINQRLIYAPDALPNNINWPTVDVENNGLIHTNGLNRPTDWPRPSSSADPRPLNGIVRNSASQWNGNVMLWAIPCIRQSSAVSQMVYVGDYPNVRGLNMEGLIPGQEISLSTDVWKVFPIGRQTAWASKAELGFQFSTGQYALAYKKVP
jgi:hypothetical protein